MPYFEAGIDIPKELPYQKKKAAPKLKMMIGSVGSRRGSNADHSHDNASIGASSVSSNARATQGNAIVSVGEIHTKRDNSDITSAHFRLFFDPPTHLVSKHKIFA